MKTMWAKPPDKKFVTHEELPRMIRNLLADIVCDYVRVSLGAAAEFKQATATMDREKATVKITAARHPVPVISVAKKPRAPGHIHRGMCGKKCFNSSPDLIVTEKKHDHNKYCTKKCSAWNL